MKYKIVVLGAGNMGTAIAQMFASNGHEVRLWDYNPETIKEIKQNGENKRFLPGIKLLGNIQPEADMDKAVSGTQIVILAVASPFVRGIAAALAKIIKNDQIIGHVAKGLEEKTYLTMHEVIQSQLKPNLGHKVVTITGPSIAKEFARGVPTAVMAMSQSGEAAKTMRQALESDLFKVATGRDFKGAGILSAIKNVYAITVGMCDGLLLSMNAKAFIFIVALKEMEAIVTAFGGKKETVYSLAGVGDLLVTSLGDGRNRALGERICKDNSCEFVFKEKSVQTFEGVAATKAIYNFLQKKKLKAPLAEMVYRVLYKGADPRKEVKNFFSKFKFDKPLMGLTK